MAYRPSVADLEVMQRASKLDTGGISTFTPYFFAPVSGTPRWDLVGETPDTWDLNFSNGEYVPWTPLHWQVVLAHDDRLDVTVIGGFGSSKTVGMAAAATYWCNMISNFKFMCVAPVGWQSRQMYDAVRQDLVDYDNRHERPTRISRMVTKMVERPYPKITWWNGSTMEFMSADEQGEKILTWSGDAACVDQAGQLDELDELVMNLGSRLRGQIGGRERMGKLILLANAYYNPALWERFDSMEAWPQYYLSIHLTTLDNPYLTTRQTDAFARRIRDPDKLRQFLMAERPEPKGKEFSRELLANARDRSLDDAMEHGRENDLPGYTVSEATRVGVWLWEMPFNELDNYILVGDPGQNAPPNRNSPCVMVFRCTGFPSTPGYLHAMWWGDGKGSYWPFVYKMEEYYRRYSPMWTAFDATGVQKGFDELVFAQRGLLVEGLNMQGLKMQMVITLKLLFGRGLLMLPEDIAGIWHQLAIWKMPDRKLRQDIASTLFMGAHMLQRLFLLSSEDLQEIQASDADSPERDRNSTTRMLRQERYTRRRRS
jgi:hypothetical protein